MGKLGTLALASLFLTTLGANAGWAAEQGKAQAQQGQQSEQKQNQSQQGQEGQRQEPKSELSKGLPPGTAKASDVIGKTLQNQQGENLGEIKDLLVNPKDNKSEFLVFDATTGFFQKVFQGRDHYLIIPWESVSYANGEFTAPLDRQQLVQVPGFRSDAWPTIDQQYREKLQSYFSQMGAQQQAQQSAQSPSQQSPQTQPAPQSQSSEPAQPDQAQREQQAQQQQQAQAGQSAQGQPGGQTPAQPSQSPSQQETQGQQAQQQGGQDQQAQLAQASGTQQSDQNKQESQQQQPQSTPPPVQSQSGAQAQQPQASGKHAKDAILIGDVVRASQFIGKEVRNQQNEKLGKVEDMVLNLRSGEVAYVVLGSGGVLGIGEKLFALPLQAFTPPQAGDQIVLAADKDQVAKAPGFDKDKWPTAANPYWSPKRGS